MTTRWLRSLTLGAVGVAILSSSCRAAGCDPTFGTQLHDWVQAKAAGLSRSLANADLDARTFNYLLVSLDQTHAGIQRTADRLEQINARVRAVEAGLGSDVLAAIQRESDSQDLLNDLFQARGELDHLRQIMASLQLPMSRVQFETNRLDQVGRTTLLESFQDLGDSAAKTLQVKYSVYVSVTVNEDGQAHGTRVGAPDQNWFDTTLFAASMEWPYLWAVYFLYEAGKLGVAEDECRKKVDEQRTLAQQALELLPSKLISVDDLFTLYQTTYATNLSAFNSDINATNSLLDSLDETWKQLVAFNSLRNHTAQSILTTEKVKQLQRQYGHDNVVTAIFDELAIGDVANDIGQLNGYLARQQTTLLRSCGDVTGFIAAEDAIDALRYSDEVYKAYGSHSTLLPLFPLIDKSASWVDRARQSAQAAAAKLKGKSCTASAPLNRTVDAEAAPFFVELPPGLERHTRRFETRMNAGAIWVGHWGMPGRAQFGLALSLAGVSSSFCTLVTSDRQTYACGSSGIPYDGQFETGGGNPQTDVLLNSRDGGYAQDNREASLEIDAVDRNLRQRIGSLSGRAQAARNALPQWLGNNQEHITRLSQANTTTKTEASAARAVFTQTNREALASALQYADDFLKSPIDKGNTEKFINAAGGLDFSLPRLPLDAIVPDVPAPAGISAAANAYPAQTSATQRSVIREMKKVAADLPAGSVRQNLARQELRVADRFALSKTDMADAIAKQLVVDSASLRFSARDTGVNPSITTVSVDGELRQVAVSFDQALPPDSILAKVDSFEAERSTLQAQVNAVRLTIPPDAPDSAQRLTVLTDAERIDSIGESLFWSGSLADGQRALNMAVSLLDVATRFIPGVNWGRDVYEATTGRDLFTGEELSNAALLIAVMGVATGGLADEEVEMLRVVRELGGEFETVEEAKGVIEAAHELSSTRLEILPHVIDEMRQEPLGEISIKELNDTLDRGSRFWDTQKKNMILLERDVFPGEVPVAAVVDIDNKVVVTAYREKRADEALAEILADGRRRFIEIPVNH
jgi:Pre-toxin TG